MKPLKLTIRAFGPYVAEEIIDFRKLGERALFLIHGPTGAGKTSILDAMCFALYGVTSGGERSAKEMRSHRADPSVLMEVIFDFSIGNKQYRIHRSPEQERPKKKGSGTTREPNRATLWDRTDRSDDTGDGSPIATQWSEVTACCEELLGFRAEQFRQVIMLPQGKFREFLVANSAERMRILETLFQTGVYRLIEDALKTAADAIRKEGEQLPGQMKFLLGQAGVETPTALEAKRDQLRADTAAAQTRAIEARRREDAATKSLTSAQAVLVRFRELEEAIAAHQTLEARSEDVTSKQTQREAAERAASLRDVEAAYVQREREVISAARQVQAVQGDMPQVREVSDKARAAFEAEKAREPERDHLQQQLSVLNGLSQKVAELEDARQNLAQLEKQVVPQSAEVTLLQIRLADCRTERDEAYKRLVANKESAARAQVLRATVRDLERLSGVLDALSKTRDELKTEELADAAATKALVCAQAAFNEAHKIRLELEHRWIFGQASILAKSLVKGLPCPVCGSTEHPMPAHAAEELPSDADVKAAREKEATCEQALNEARLIAEGASRRLNAARQGVAAREEQLGEARGKTKDDVGRELRSAAWQLKQAEDASAKAVQVEAELERLRQEEETLPPKIQEAENSLRTLLTSRADAEATVRTRESDVPEPLRSSGAIKAKFAVTNQRIETLRRGLEKAQSDAGDATRRLASAEQALKSAQEVEIQAREQLAQARQNFLTRLTEAGFNAEPEYAAASLEATTLHALTQELEEYEKELAAASARLQRAQDQTARLTKPDVEELSALAESSKREVELSVSRASALGAQLAHVERFVEEAQAIAIKLMDADRRYAIIGRVAEVANGRNAQGINLQRFVLGALMDEILAAASERFRRMSRGRYQLQRAGERLDMRSAGGLDITVYDGYTGTIRSVSTLSGGEQFQASLALALALSDVVQGYAGGIRLETIFIDEGFGSLDGESLDLALQTLIELQRSGRLVGIISHIADLRERIDARLEVVPERDGSRITVYC